MAEAAHRASIMAWAAYFAVAPVFWLPGVSEELVLPAKRALFLAALVVTFVAARVPLLTGRFGIEGFALATVASLPAVLQTESDAVVARWLFGLALIAAAVIAFRSMKDGAFVFMQAALIAGVTVGALSAAIAGGSAVGFDITSTVSGVNVELSTTGFSTGRTEWSNAVALFSPVLLLGTFRSRRQQLIAGAAAVAIAAGQLTVGGRTGLAITVVAAIISFGRGSRFSTWIAAAGALGFVALAAAGGLETPSTLQRGSGSTELSEVTTGRSEQWAEALDQIQSRPILGTGLGTAVVSDPLAAHEGVEVHNLWLKLGVEAGVLLPLMVLGALSHQIVLNTKKLGLANATTIVLLGGLAMSMVEPNAPIGSFNKTVLFWCCLGAAADLHRQPSSGDSSTLVATDDPPPP